MRRKANYYILNFDGHCLYLKKALARSHLFFNLNQPKKKLPVAFIDKTQSAETSSHAQ